MNSPNGVLRILGGWLSLQFVQMAVDSLLGIKAPSAPHFMLWVSASNLLIAGAIGFAALRCNWRGWQLGLAVAGVPFAIRAMNLIEGVAYHTRGADEWPRILVGSFLTFLLVGPLWFLAFEWGREARTAKTGSPRSVLPEGKLWRLALADFIYFVLYFAAGLTIFPLVKDFYAHQALPPFGTIVGLQLLIRGPVFVAVSVVLLRMINLPRASGAFAVGMVFTVVSGVAAMLIPDPFLPDSVRWVHFWEITVSNFLFAVFTAWLWTPRGRSALGAVSAGNQISPATR